MLKFISFSSGSCGNCSLLSDGEDSLLLDAGVGIRTMKRRFLEYGVNVGKLRGILITHAHADHIYAAGRLSHAYNLPVYATQIVHDGIQHNFRTTRKVDEPYRRVINKDETFQIGKFHITAFELPHDTAENLGYRIETPDGTFTLMTDVGHITDRVAENIRLSNYIVIEADYDEEMLAHGSYPDDLKQRIAGGSGHLSNKQCAQVLAENFHSGIKHIYLCHRSGENNTEAKAYGTVARRLAEAGYFCPRDYALDVLKRGEVCSSSQPVRPNTLFSPYKESKGVGMLFDLDGTLLDTEAGYTQFWGQIGQKYRPDLPNFNQLIKGTTLTQIYDLYIAPPYRDEITAALDKHEQQMAYRFFDGATTFLRWLRANGLPTVLVTSSNQKKMQCVRQQIPDFDSYFDIILSSEDFQRSKPHPDCYLKAASMLGLQPSECIVFEDAINGLQSARAAGCHVVGLPTTNSITTISQLCDSIIEGWDEAYLHCVQKIS